MRGAGEREKLVMTGKEKGVHPALPAEKGALGQGCSAFGEKPDWRGWVVHGSGSHRRPETNPFTGSTRSRLFPW